MGKIKTALELAMEEMDDIEVDYEKINNDKLIKDGKILAGKGLAIDYKLKKLEKELAKYNEVDKKKVITSLLKTVLKNITLPSDDLFEARFNRCTMIFLFATDNDKNVEQIMQQMLSLCKQYSTSVNSLLDNLKEKYAEVAKQQNVNLEDNKDFINMYQSNLEEIKKQYQATMDKGKESLSAILFK